MDAVPLLVAIVRCHCSVLWFGGRVTTNFGGVDVVPLLGAIKACYDWVPAWWPALREWIFHCRVPMHSNGIQKKHPEKLPWASYKDYTVLYIDNTKIGFYYLGSMLFFFEKSWLVIQKKSSQKGVTLMSGISPLAAWLRWLGSRDWRWWNIWIRFVRNVGFRDGHLSPPYSLAPGKVTWDDACWTARMKDKSRCFWYLEALHLCVKISRNRGVSHARALMKIRRLKTVVRMRHTFGRDKNRHYFGSFFFSIKGEEEVDYLYNNLADLADSEKLLICRSPMAVSMAFHVWFC